MSYASLVGFSVIRDVSGGAVYYTPPIAREALDATFTLEATHFVAGAALVVTVEHKDLADTSWATAGTFGTITGTGVSTLPVSDLKEEIRLKCGFSGGSQGDFAHLVVAEPAWVPG
jgi:hypothetical protein